MSVRTLLVSLLLAVFVISACAWAAEKTGKMSFEWGGSAGCMWDTLGPGYSRNSVRCEGNQSKTMDLKPGSYEAKPSALWALGKYFPSVSFTIRAGETTTVAPKVGQVAFYHAGKNPIWYVALADGSKETQIGLGQAHDATSTSEVQTIDLPPGSYKVFYKLPISAYEVPGQEKYGTRVIWVRDGSLASVKP